MSAENQKLCNWCGEPFAAVDPAQMFCKKGHATRAHAKRVKEKKRLAEAGRCPTPNKRVFTSEEHASRWHIDFNTQHLYPCKCGGLHAATIREPVDELIGAE